MNPTVPILPQTWANRAREAVPVRRSRVHGAPHGADPPKFTYHLPY